MPLRHERQHGEAGDGGVVRIAAVAEAAIGVLGTGEPFEAASGGFLGFLVHDDVGDDGSRCKTR